jgi:hypothetical protein
VIRDDDDDDDNDDHSSGRHVIKQVFTGEDGLQSSTHTFSGRGIGFSPRQ